MIRARDIARAARRCRWSPKAWLLYLWYGPVNPLERDLKAPDGWAYEWVLETNSTETLAAKGWRPVARLALLRVPVRYEGLRLMMRPIATHQQATAELQATAAYWRDNAEAIVTAKFAGELPPGFVAVDRQSSFAEVNAALLRQSPKGKQP